MTKKNIFVCGSKRMQKRKDARACAIGKLTLAPRKRASNNSCFLGSRVA